MRRVEARDQRLGTSVEDAAAELAVARAQERIARQREGN
jgi:hypothetical protein